MMKMKSSLLVSTALVVGSVVAPAFAQDSRNPTADSRNVESLSIPRALGGTYIPEEVQGDNLGNHIANRDLEMNGNSITDARNLRMRGIIFGPMLINMEINGRINGLALQPNENSEAASKWYVDQMMAGARDNLGNHIADYDIDANGNLVVNMGDANLSNEGDAVNVKVLRDYVRNHGDNLGNHNASNHLTMNGNNVDLGDRDVDGNLIAGGEHGKIVNMAEPSEPGDATTKRYVDDLVRNIDFPDFPGMPDIVGDDGIVDIPSGANPIVISVDNTVVRTGLQIRTPENSGLEGGGPLTGDLSLRLDDTVVRTFGDQTIGGHKTFTDPGRFTKMLSIGSIDSDLNTNAWAPGYVNGSGIALARNDGAQKNFIIGDNGSTMEIGVRPTDDGFGPGSTLILNQSEHDINWAKLRSAGVAMEGRNWASVSADTGLLQINQYGSYLTNVDEWVKLQTGAETPGETYFILDANGRISSKGTYHLGDHRVRELMDPEAPQDAVNLRTLQRYITEIPPPAASGDNLGNHKATQTLEMLGQKITRAKTIGFGSFNLDPEVNNMNATGNGMVVGLRERDNKNIVIGGQNQSMLIGLPDPWGNGNVLSFNGADWDSTGGFTWLNGTHSVKVSGHKRARLYSDTEAIVEIHKDGRGTGMYITDRWANFYGATINVNGGQIKNIADPTNPTDAVNLRTMQSMVTGAVGAIPTGDNLGNHTATTNITMNNNRVRGMADPQNDTDAVNLRTLTSTLDGVVQTTGDQTVSGVKTFRSNTTVFQRAATGGSSIVMQPGSSGNGQAVIRGPNGNGTLIMSTGTTQLVEGRMLIDTRRVTAGAGLTGGGQLTGDITLAVDDSVVRSGPNQEITGQKDFMGIVNVTNTRTGVTAFRVNNTGAGSVAFFCNDTRNTGGCGGTQAWTQHSDERLKKDIVDLEAERGLEAIRQIRPVTYLWKEEGMNDASGVRSLGLIAQDIEAVFPELVKSSPFDREVNGENIANVKSVSYAELVSPLVLAVQQLDAKQTASEARIEELSANLAAMEARLSALEAR